MKNSRWRVGAIIVGIVDLFAAFGLMIWTVIKADQLAKAVFDGMNNWKSEKCNEGFDADYHILYEVGRIWVVVATVVLILLGNHLLAAITLLRSTVNERDPNEALNEARFWRNVAIGYLVPAIPGCGWVTFLSIYSGFYMWFYFVVMPIIYVQWRAMAILIVQMFVKELEGRVNFPISVITQQ